MVKRFHVVVPTSLLLCLLGTWATHPQPVLASLSQQDHDDLYESLQTLSAGWVQEHVDQANQILSRTIYTAADWEEFFTEYFNANSFTDDLRNYLVYPVFWWFSGEAHLNLQLGLIGPMESNIEAIVSEHHSDLGGALNADPDLRQTMFNSHRFLNDMLKVGVIDDSAKTQIYDFCTQHIDAYPQLWKRSVTLDVETQPYVATVRAQLYMNLGDALPLTTNRKSEIAQTIDLTGSYLTVWTDHSVLVVDNNGLDKNQLGAIDTYLSKVPASLHNLRYISVNSLLGNEGDRYQWFANSAGVNIFDTPVGGVIENEFPGDVDPRCADAFSIVLAHEVNHMVDAFFSNNDPTLANRKGDLIEAAGDFHMNYLRSMFDDEYFTTYPQEFFASIANQWFADSAHTLELGLVRWENGYLEPINQFLFFAEVYSQGEDEVPFYTLDEQGTLTRTMVTTQRDGNGHIHGLMVDEEWYRFALDSDGNVVTVLRYTVNLPIVMR